MNCLDFSVCVEWYHALSIAIVLFLFCTLGRICGKPTIKYICRHTYFEKIRKASFILPESDPAKCCKHGISLGKLQTSSTSSIHPRTLPNEWPFHTKVFHLSINQGVPPAQYECVLFTLFMFYTFSI